jgi:hypothetical protein
MPQKDMRMVYAIAPGVMTLKLCIFAWPGLGAGRDPGARKAVDGAWKICRPTCSKVMYCGASYAKTWTHC